MAKPTAEELSIINTKFAKETLTEDDLYVFPDRMIDNLPTSYSSRIHPNLLAKFEQDAKGGIGLLMNHNSRTLPVGRSFDALLKMDTVPGQNGLVPTLYGKYYMLLGINTQQGMTTSDLAKSISAGTVFDTSIGFSAESWKCSICNHDIRDYNNCMHWPGDKYMVEIGEGVKEEQMCYVDVGEDGKGQVLENSLVYAGASGRATIVKEFSENNRQEHDPDEKPLSKLSVVTDLKLVPLSANVFQYLSADGAVSFTDTTERNDITKVRSETLMAGTNDQTQNPVSGQDLSADLESARAQLSVKEGELQAAKAQLSAKDGELATANQNLAAATTVNDQLTAQVAELQPKAALAETYVADLIEQALEAGVRAQGNNFKREQFAKFFKTLSVDEVKEYRDGFQQSFTANLSHAQRITAANELNAADPDAGKLTHRSDFASEQEYREHVGREAIQYAKDNSMSVADATLKLHAEYMKEVK